MDNQLFIKLKGWSSLKCLILNFFSILLIHLNIKLKNNLYNLFPKNYTTIIINYENPIQLYIPPLTFLPPQIWIESLQTKLSYLPSICHLTFKKEGDIYCKSFKQETYPFNIINTIHEENFNVNPTYTSCTLKTFLYSFPRLTSIFLRYFMCNCIQYNAFI
jgi:hypothetical protein